MRNLIFFLWFTISFMLEKGNITLDLHLNLHLSSIEIGDVLMNIENLV